MSSLKRVIGAGRVTYRSGERSTSTSVAYRVETTVSYRLVVCDIAFLECGHFEHLQRSNSKSKRMKCLECLGHSCHPSPDSGLTLISTERVT